MMYGCSMQHSLVWICCLVSRCMHVGFLAHRMKSVMLWHAKQLTLRFQSLRLQMSSSFIVDSGWLFVRNLLSVLPYQSYTHIGAIAQFHIELLFTVGGLLQLVAVQCFYCFLYQLVCLVCKWVLGYSQLWLTKQAINSIQFNSKYNAHLATLAQPSAQHSSIPMYKMSNKILANRFKVSYDRIVVATLRLVLQ